MNRHDGSPFVIAELGASHLGSLDNMIKLIEAAKDSGADAVKFQYYTPDSITIDHDGPGFILTDGPWAGRKLYDLYAEAHTPPAWFPDLFQYARDIGIQAFSSVFAAEDVAKLERFDPPYYKISSFDIGDHRLIREVKKTGKPVILSTGMASWEEIREADDNLGEEYPHTFLWCVSGYPTPAEEANLGQIAVLAGKLAMRVGLSDHTLGIEVPIAAAALGACVIEKHLCLDRSLGGPDSGFSLEPQEFRQMVESIRRVHQAIQTRAKSSEATSVGLRKTIYAVASLSVGDCLEERHVRALRPGLGLPAKFYDAILGKSVRCPLKYGDSISWDHLSE